MVIFYTPIVVKLVAILSIMSLLGKIHGTCDYDLKMNKTD